VVREHKESSVAEIEYSSDHFAHTLRRTGFSDIADEAVHVLPDPVGSEQIGSFLAPYGITLDEIINRMGGSP
jgi:hypothetical protein